MDLTEELVQFDEIESILMSNLSASQLSLNDEFRDGDFIDLQNWLEGDLEDLQTSNLFAPQATRVELLNIQCFHCGELFDSDFFEFHVCTFDQNHQEIQVEVKEPDEPDEEFQKLSSETIQTMRNNQANLHDVSEQMKDRKSDDSEFINQSGLNLHYDKHIGDLITKPLAEYGNKVELITLCNICGEAFEVETDVWDHLTTRHNEVFDCETSGSMSDGGEQSRMEQEANKSSSGSYKDVLSTVHVLLQNHPSTEFVRQIVKSKVFQCEFCDSIFAEAKKAMDHIAKHPPSSCFHCEPCKLNNLSLSQILLHRNSQCAVRHPLRDLTRVWFCNVCDGEFGGLEELQEHRHKKFHFIPRIEPATNKLLFTCELCLQHFSSAPQLIDHFSTIHLKKPRLNQIFQTSTRDLKPKVSRRGGIHQTSTLPRLHLCEVCGKSYTQSSHLWQHLRFHKGIKPFVCTYEGCDKRFTIRPDLSDHIRKHHTGERPYLCKICGMRFLTGSVYYQHRLIHRGERRYECKQCDKTFNRSDGLKNHQLIHTGCKPFSCSECHKSFRQRGDRDKHFKVLHPHATLLHTPRKKLTKSFGRGNIKNNTSLYQATPQ